MISRAVRTLVSSPAISSVRLKASPSSTRASSSPSSTILRGSTPWVAANTLPSESRMTTMKEAGATIRCRSASAREPAIATCAETWPTSLERSSSKSPLRMPYSVKRRVRKMAVRVRMRAIAIETVSRQRMLRDISWFQHVADVPNRSDEISFSRRVQLLA